MAEDLAALSRLDVNHGTLACHAQRTQILLQARDPHGSLDQRGSMGHTLASFKEHHHAEAFAETHGGELYAFDDIDLDLLARLSRGELGGGDAMGGSAGHGSDGGH